MPVPARYCLGEPPVGSDLPPRKAWPNPQSRWAGKSRALAMSTPTAFGMHVDAKPAQSEHDTDAPFKTSSDFPHPPAGGDAPRELCCIDEGRTTPPIAEPAGFPGSISLEVPAM